MKHWALRIFLFLLLGALVNVAVAWGCAMRVPMDATWVYRTDRIESSWQPFSTLGYDRDGFLEVDQWRRFGSTRLHITAGDFHHWPDGDPAGAPLDSCPSWAREWLEEALASESWLVESLEARGWPRPALWCVPAELDVLGNGINPPRWGVQIPDRFAAPYDRFTKPTLPLRPIWPGFAINTVFYAVVLWLLFAGPFVVRRWRRIRRGLCPKCAYDLRGTPSDATACPECGEVTDPGNGHRATSRTTHPKLG